jgi:alginate O-acetyltransferase complex protein AlgJ
MARFLIRSILFLALPVALYLCATLLTPIDYYSFRVWEALKTTSWLFPWRPFYPDYVLSKSEVGDLANRSPYAVPKQVTWRTDQYGMRIVNGALGTDKDPDCEIVIVGDSLTVGTGLDESETLAAQLYENLGSVCAYATASFEAFLSDPRFKSNFPKVVVFERMERYLWRLKRLRPPNKLVQLVSEKTYHLQSSSKSFLRLSIALDRVLKGSVVLYLRAWLESAINSGMRRAGADVSQVPFHSIKSDRSNQLFLKESLEQEVDAEDIERAALVIQDYKRAVETRGARFLFLAIPNKETVYIDQLPVDLQAKFHGAKGSNLKNLLEALDLAQVISVSPLESYLERHYQGQATYLSDDSHWNALGVKIAAQLLSRAIEEHCPL